MLRTARFALSLLGSPASWLFLSLFVCAVVIVTPALGQLEKPSPAPPRVVSPIRESLSANPLSSTPNVTRINKLAVRIATAPTEEAADALLAEHSATAGVDLARAILSEMIRRRDANENGEEILRIGLRLYRYTNRPEMTMARALAHRGLGLAHAYLNRSNLAEKEFLSAVNLFRRAGETSQPDLIWTMLDLAALYAAGRDNPRAIEYYETVLPLAGAIGDKDSVVLASNGLATLYSQSIDLMKAHKYMDASLAATAGMKDKALKLSNLGRLAFAFVNQGRMVKAVEAYDMAYQTAVELGSPTTADYLYQSALAYIKVGDFVAAYSRFRKLQAETAASPDRRLYVYSLLNIAWIYKRHARETRAIELYHRAIALADAEIAKSSDQRLVYVPIKAEAVNRLAEIHAEQQDAQTAIRLYTENLNTLRSTPTAPDDDPRARTAGPHAKTILEIEINTNLGELYSSLGNSVDASARFASALDLAKKAGYETGSIDTMLSMATHAARVGDPQKALSHMNSVELLIQRSGRLDQMLKLRTITAAVLRKLNRPAAADLAFQEALRISESRRTDATMPDQRASYFASLFAPFDEYIDFLMDRHEKEPDAGFDGKAFNVSERRRARALLDSLKVARADIRQGVDPELLDQENRIRSQLNSVAREHFSTIDRQFRPIIDDDPNVYHLSRPRSDVALLSAELARVETAIRKQSPRYAELMQPRPLRWGAMQTLLDEKTVLLNYTLGAKRSYLWAITRDRVKSFVLPPREQIEALVKSAYDEMSGAPELDGSMMFTPATERLSRLLLEPAVDTIADRKIVIVADGSLQYLPFSSLPDPRTLASQTKSLMLRSNEIQFAPSASVVAVLRQEAERRPRPRNTVAIFADPVFSADDERFDGIEPGGPVSSGSIEGVITRDLLDTRFLKQGTKGDAFDIPRLPFSRLEAESIFSSAPAGSSFKALDFEASREKFASVDLSEYGIVHFATHGILHSEHPELSGVVLSLFNEKAEPVNGFLRLNEIYNMKLNADLVVLSACQTALGKEVRGEGLIGLTRGFMYAGSPRVVASLWKVDDVATAELMKIFYQKMLREKMRPASALRAAKIEMMQQKRWGSPYFWAAFELQGEWR